MHGMVREEDSNPLRHWHLKARSSFPKILTIATELASYVQYQLIKYFMSICLCNRFCYWTDMEKSGIENNLDTPYAYHFVGTFPQYKLQEWLRVRQGRYMRKNKTFFSARRVRIQNQSLKKYASCAVKSCDYVVSILHMQVRYQFIGI